MTKQADPQLQEKLRQMREKVAETSKIIVKRTEAWRYFINWASSYPAPITPASGDADILLNIQQSSEFAFNHDMENHHETFVLFAQQANYDWLSNIGIKCLILEDDGIIVMLDEVDIYGVYIGSKSFKITVAEHMLSKMQNAKKLCKNAQIACIKHQYDPKLDTVNWSIEEITSAIHVVDNYQASLRL